MTFDFTNTTPAASEAPAQSQPKMLQNFQSTETILAVDHVSFNNATGGQHTKVTYVDNISPASPSGDTTIGYSDVGIADPGTPQHYWKNRDATFPLSAIKAFGVFNATNLAPVTTLLNEFNVLSISSTVNQFVIILENDVVANNDVAVFVYCERPDLISSYSFINDVLTINTALASLTKKMSFVILQI